METSELELNSLQNMADASGLSIVIHEKIIHDKRNKVKKYFANIEGKGTISPVLDYSNLNHFLLGISQAKELFS